MTSLGQLRKDLETVRRALNPNPTQEYYRKNGQEITRILQAYEETVALEAAASTTERAQEITAFLQSTEVATVEDATLRGHLQNVLSEYQRRHNPVG